MEELGRRQTCQKRRLLIRREGKRSGWGRKKARREVRKGTLPWEKKAVWVSLGRKKGNSSSEGMNKDHGRKRLDDLGESRLPRRRRR